MQDAAKQYYGQLLDVPQSALPRNATGLPVFDLILLGVGPDGHICSLFPNRPETAAKEGWCVVYIPDSFAFQPAGGEAHRVVPDDHLCSLFSQLWRPSPGQASASPHSPCAQGVDHLTTRR
jgi:Glucosamine-6-phosphate isomerases/6-phosphogluconolactonase